MGNTGVNLLRAALLEQGGGVGQGAGGLGQIVHHEDVLTADFTDDGDGFHLGGALAAFGDDGEAGVQYLGLVSEYVTV